jgi:hypothetical protein
MVPSTVLAASRASRGKVYAADAGVFVDFAQNSSQLKGMFQVMRERNAVPMLYFDHIGRQPPDCARDATVIIFKSIGIRRDPGWAVLPALLK